MPAYEFEITDEAGTPLRRFTLLLPVNKRDSVKLRRVTVPDRIAISGAARDPHNSDGESLLRGYHRQEEKLGSRFKSGFTPEQIKRAAALP